MSAARGGFVAFTLGRPVTVFMLLVTMILVGVLASQRMALELLPAGFESSRVTINIPVPNANPVEVEEQVTRPTEDVLRRMSGIEELQTVSSKDSCRINLVFARTRNPDEAFAEVRDLMELAKLSWPEDVQDYRTFRFDLDTDLPVFQFGVHLDEWESDTSFVMDQKITRRLESVEGVARVGAGGIVEETIRIFVDEDRALALGISLFEIAQTLGADNRDVIGGRVKEDDRYYYLRSLGRFETLEDVENYPIRSGVKIGDVAEVVTAFAFRDSVFRLDGRRAVWFTVFKESSANTVEVCRRVRAALKERIESDPRIREKDWRFYVPPMFGDSGQLVESALGELGRSSLIGGALAIIPLLLFLRRLRMTVIVMLAVPISLLITVACLYFTGRSINLLSMMGITIAIGMLVDNSIVVIENIFRRREEGLDARTAALAGTSEVGLAVALATLTTVAVFVPLIFDDGDAMTAYFMKAIGLPVCYAVLGSLIAALLFIPLATVVFERDRGSESPQNGSGASRSLLAAIAARGNRAVERALEALCAFHAVILGFALRRRLVAILIIFGLTHALTSWCADNARFAIGQDESGGMFNIDVRLDDNFTLGDANEVFRRIYGQIESDRDEYGIEVSWMSFTREGGNLTVILDEDDAEHTRRVTQAIEERLPAIPGARVRVGVQRRNAAATNYEIRVYGPEVAELARIGDDLIDRLEGVDGVTRVSGSGDRRTDEIIVAPDRERMQLYGVRPQVLMGTVQYGIRGQRLPDFHFGDQRMQMFIEFDEADDTTLGDLQRMNVWSDGTGEFQPLGNVADVYYARGYGTIRKTQGRASVALTVETLEGKNDELTDRLDREMTRVQLPPGYTWQEDSKNEAAEERAAVGATGLLATILIVLIMGVLFESIMLPPAVFMTIPFALLGGFWLLTLTDAPVDEMSMIGGIVLIGVVVNNGIVFMDAAHRLVRSGEDRRTALLTAGRRRLRPILMTTATTVVGLLPMALTDSSSGWFSYKTMARAVIGGLIVSTMATLVVVPVFYTLLDDLRRRLGEAVRVVLVGRPLEDGDDGPRAITPGESEAVPLGGDRAG